MERMTMIYVDGNDDKEYSDDVNDEKDDEDEDNECNVNLQRSSLPKDKYSSNFLRSRKLKQKQQK